MLPIPAAGLGKVDLPLLPPTPSGPNPSAPGTFNRVYDKMLSGDDRMMGRLPVLPTAMEVRPLLAPATTLAQPFTPAEAAVHALNAEGLRIPGKTIPAGAAANDPFQFLEPLTRGADEINQLAKTSEMATQEAAYGGDVDLHDVMIAAEKASVALQLGLQVRNKLVEAYQDVMRMQV